MHKTNVLTFAGDLWQRTVDDVSKEYRSVERDYNHVDAACIYLVEQPARYDVIVTDNLFGDILTDLAGAVSGGIGFAASANLNPARTGPSLFEPVHGAAHDIVGTGRANPLAAIRSAALDARPSRGSLCSATHRQGGLLVPCRKTRRVPVPVHRRRRRRHRRKGVAMPITPSQTIWFDGELVPWEEAKIHVLSHSLHYGSGVFEGIRAYRTRSGVAVFRLTDHINRLFDSAKILMIDTPWSPADLVDACKTVVRENGLDDGCYVRPIIFLGYGEMGLNPLPCPVNVAIAAWPWGSYLGEEGVAKGVRLKVSSWQRHDPNAVPTAAKSTGMYVNSSLAKVEALKAGYDEALLLAPDGHVSECTGENVFVVRGRRIPAPTELRRGRTARHHAGVGRDDRMRPGVRRVARSPGANRPLHRRRGVPDRDRGRGRPYPRGGRQAGRGRDPRA